MAFKNLSQDIFPELLKTNWEYIHDIHDKTVPSNWVTVPSNLKNFELHFIFFFSLSNQKIPKNHKRGVLLLEIQTALHLCSISCFLYLLFLLIIEKQNIKKWRVFPFSYTSKQPRPDEFVRLFTKLASHPNIPIFLSLKNVH